LKHKSTDVIQLDKTIKCPAKSYQHCQYIHYSRTQRQHVFSSTLTTEKSRSFLSVTSAFARAFGVHAVTGSQHS